MPQGSPNLLSHYVLDSRWPPDVRDRYNLLAYALLVPIGLSMSFPAYLWWQHHTRSTRRHAPHAAVRQSGHRAPMLLSHALLAPLEADPKRMSTRSEPELTNAVRIDAPPQHVQSWRSTR